MTVLFRIPRQPWMHRGSILLCLLLATAMNVGAKDYFVAPGGVDTKPGTKASPFRTIQKAASVMHAGDRCLIRAGTYREMVVPAHSGKANAPITFEAFEGEKVVISGTDVVSCPWKQHKDSIFAASMPWTLGPGKDMVFVDGKVVIQARHPNTHTAQSKPPPIELPPLWMTYGNFKVSLNSPDITNLTDLNQEPKDYWKGALYAGWHDWGWCMQSAEVESSRKGVITVKNKTGNWWFPDSTPKTKFGQYNQGYLTHHLNALDKAGEWHHQDKTLYLWSPHDKDPSGSLVEAKMRHLAFDLRNRNHITLKDLRVMASSVNMDDANDCVIDGCRMSFVSHFTVFDDARDGYIEDHKVKDKKSAPQRGEVGVYVGGTNNTIRNSVIKYSAGAGLFLAGYRTTVTNCIIHDCGYAGNYVGGIFITFNPLVKQEDLAGVRGGHTITHNELYNSGRALIAISSISGVDKPTVYDAIDIGYNRIHDGCITGHDGGLINSWSVRLGTGESRTKWHHNMLWDQWGYFWAGIAYPDNATYALDIHDNILWQSSISRKTQFFKHNPPGDPKYFNNTEKPGYDGGVEGLKDADYPGGKVFKTGPTIQDEKDSWYP